MHTLYCSSSSKLYIYHDVVYGNKQFVTVCVLKCLCEGCLLLCVFKGHFCLCFICFVCAKKVWYQFLLQLNIHLSVTSIFVNFM